MNFASDRYYASEWFRQSRLYLRDDTLGPQENEKNPFQTSCYDMGVASAWFLMMTIA